MSMHKDIARFVLQGYRRFMRFSRETGIKLVIADGGEGLRVFGRVRIDMPQKIYIGKNCTLNEGVLLVGREDIFIGSNVTISANTVITSAALDLDGEERHKAAPVTIKDNVWLAANVTVLSGVTIGEGAVVAAGAVVTKDIPPNTMAAGVPAIPVRNLKPQTLAA
jgi:acetyltransferase-like isoleucine patch superfamily enzyme